MDVYVQERPLLKRIVKLLIMLYQPIGNTYFLEGLNERLSSRKYYSPNQNNYETKLKLN
jgi:hypothetical protein